ncbi:MAG: hypothetical protein QXE66_05325 [Desulfurococcaceae archaeon]
MKKGKPVYSSYKTGLNTSTHSKSTSKTPSDFSNEYVGKKVRIVLYNSVVEGVLENASKYWFKISNGGKTVYVNKGWVVFIEPIMI